MDKETSERLTKRSNNDTGKQKSLILLTKCRIIYHVHSAAFKTRDLYSIIKKTTFLFLKILIQKKNLLPLKVQNSNMVL